MKKNYNMEMIRLLSFIMVILIHVTNYFCRGFTQIGTGEYLFALVIDTFARVSVPCFFMLSGALLLGKTETLEKNTRRVIRFVSVLLFWSVVYYLFNTFYMDSYYDLKRLLVEPTEPHLWYLYAMIPIYLVLPFFQIMCRGMDVKLDKIFLIIVSVTAVILYFTSLGTMELYYDVPIVGDKSYTFYFFLGYFLFKYKESLMGKGKLLFGVFAGSTIINILLTTVVTYTQGEHYERLLEYGSPLVMLSGAGFFAWMLQLKQGEMELNPKMQGWIDTCCSCSFGIYLLHIVFLDHYKKYMEPESVSAWVAIPGLTIGILVVSFVCVWLLRKLPFGRYIS